MTEDIDWIEEARGYDANAALEEMKAMWLQLARKCSRVVADCGDWLDDAKSVDEAMQWAVRAEACMWRATGDHDAIDVDLFVPAIAAAARKGGDNSLAPGEAPQSGHEVASPTPSPEPTT